jgi:hypothetical protein
VVGAGVVAGGTTSGVIGAGVVTGGAVVGVSVAGAQAPTRILSPKAEAKKQTFLLINPPMRINPEKLEC